MALLAEATWHGAVFSGGWRASKGGDRAVVAPATGEELGRAGIANQADVAQAAARAARAQPAWAATNFEQREAIMRRAGTLIEQHAAEIEGWITRETGAIPPVAQLSTHVASQECYEAAAVASHPIGQIIPSARRG